MRTRTYATMFLWLLVFLFVLFSVSPARATDYTSTSFILRDPVISVEGERSSSTNFQYFSSTGQTIIGENTSSTFVHRAGFLYFPTATSAVISATPGNSQVSLTWSAAQGILGNITEYQVGTATVTGGPYTYTTVGSVLSSDRTGLTNGTAYFFRVRAYAAGELVSESAEVSGTPAAPVVTPPSGGGGGGGGAVAPAQTGVNFLGRAYPFSKVTVLRDGQLAITTIAGPDARFNVSLTGLSSGSYIFTVYSEDSALRRSGLFNFPVTITSGAMTTVSGIFLTPTIDVDKSEVVKGSNISIFGQSVPEAAITIVVNSPQEILVSTTADSDGAYLHAFDTTPLELGHHLTKSKAARGSEISSFSSSVAFLVGTKDVARRFTECRRADLNCDGRVNLVDFSIAAFWYKRSLSDAFKQVEKERLNGDGKIDLVDFSIMAYHWTG